MSRRTHGTGDRPEGGDRTCPAGRDTARAGTIGARDCPLEPVAVVRTPQVMHHDAPRQAGLPPFHHGAIEVHQGFQNLLKDLDGFSHLWVLWWGHHSRGWNERVVPPRDSVKRGLFATRAPHRPNPIGLSCVQLLGIEKRVLRIGGHDMLDGTPVLDLKPYIPAYDSVPDARAGWLAELPPDDGGSDHRRWWEDGAGDGPNPGQPNPSGPSTGDPDIRRSSEPPGGE